MLVYFLLWFPMIPIAIANGMLREKVYGPKTSERAAHQISSAIAVLLFGLYAWIVFTRWPVGSGTEAMVVGGIWGGMTILFEFGFGHYVAGHSWSRLVSDYNLLEGRVWSLVLAAIFLLPWICFAAWID
jgi:hypothetical protein